MSGRAPRAARVLLGLVAERDDSIWLLDDLEELYAAKLADDGRWRANAWYWSQVVRSVLPLARRRLRPKLPVSQPWNPPMPFLPQESKPGERVARALYHLRHAFRRLLREPAFTTAAVLTLALGVGANVAVFAVVEAVLLRPLGYVEADRLVILNHRDQRTGITKEFIAIGDYVDIIGRQSAFESVAAYGTLEAMIFGGGEPYRVVGLSAAPGLLELLRVRPVLGRSLRPEDALPGAGRVVVLGYEHWRDRYGSDRSILGRSIRINNFDRTVVGVTPPGFRFPPAATTEVVIPMTLPQQAPAQRKSGWTFAVGRLKPGRTIQDASADLSRISRQLEEEFPQSNRASSYYGVALRDALVGSTKSALVLLLAAVGVVLLIACANVANLLLARSLSRRREMALRMALGASRGRLAAQLLSESLVLALVASIVGILFAHWGARALVALVPRSVSVPGLADVHINAAVLAFAIGLTVITTLTFGLVAMTTVRADGAAGILIGGGRLSMSAPARRAASGLVVAEVALAIVLLIGAGLIVRTFMRLLSVDPGFRVDRVMTMDVALPPDRYQEAAARDGFYRQAFAALRAVRGVEDVGAAVVTPLTGNNWTVAFERPELPVPPSERPPEVGWQVASGGYFRTLHIPLVAGRLFDERDHANSPPVVIISEAIQKRYFRNENPIGRQLKGGNGIVEIVGVVGDIRRAGLRDDPRADLYFPFERNPSGSITVFVRTTSDPTRALPTLQAAVKSVEPRVVLGQAMTLSDIASESVRTTKLVLWLLGIFATTALALAAVGIYGVMSYVVRQRTREIGTRIALGATRLDILWLVMRQGVAIAGFGTAIGLLGGLLATRSLGSILYGVSSSDPLTLAASAGVLLFAIMAACYLPARRAARVDPARTLAEL